MPSFKSRTGTSCTKTNYTNACEHSIGLSATACPQSLDLAATGMSLHDRSNVLFILEHMSAQWCQRTVMLYRWRLAWQRASKKAASWEWQPMLLKPGSSGCWSGLARWCWLSAPSSGHLLSPMHSRMGFLVSSSIWSHGHQATSRPGEGKQNARELTWLALQKDFLSL